MVQLSMVGYAVSGAFLSLGFFDLYYALVAVTAVTQVVVRKEIRKEQPAEGIGSLWQDPVPPFRALVPVPAPASIQGSAASLAEGDRRLWPGTEGGGRRT